MRRLAAAALVVAALAAAGCGGGKSGGAGSLPDGAAQAPADAPAFISLNTTGSSWEKALSLARRFPSFTTTIDQSELDRLKAAVGPEVDLVWLDFAKGGDDVVALTKPTTLAMLKAAITGDEAFADLSGGWVAFAQTQALLDRFQKRARGDKLDGDDDFKDGFAQLAAEASVRTWIRGEPVQSALDHVLTRAAPRITHDLGTLRFLSGSASAKGDGAAFDLRARLDPASHPQTFTPSLAAAVPAGAVLYVGATKLDDPTRIILRMVGESRPSFETQLKRVEGITGISLDDDIYPLLHEESALAVYRGAATGTPPILFLQKVADADKADALLRRITALARLGGADGKTVELGGKTVQALTFSGTTVYYGVARRRIFVATTLDLAQEGVTGPGTSLADAELYRSARAAAAPPDKVAAFAYGDLKNGLPFIFDLAESGGSRVTAEARANAKPLESGFAYLVEDGDSLRVSGFTAIK